MMREGFDLPPLMFTRDEIVALVAGARMVRAFGGAAMARAADEALVKIGAVLPDAEKDRIARTEIHTPMWVVSDAAREAIDLIERAVEKRQVLTIDYSDEAGRSTVRDIRPLGLWFWGKVWTLVAWCEMRDDFRAFRIDRIASVVIAGRVFKPERGKQLADFYRAVERSEDYGMAPDRAARTEALLPSPLVGPEGRARPVTRPGRWRRAAPRRKRGVGRSASCTPHPAASRPPSPTRGEGTAPLLTPRRPYPRPSTSAPRAWRRRRWRRVPHPRPLASPAPARGARSMPPAAACRRQAAPARGHARRG